VLEQASDFRNRVGRRLPIRKGDLPIHGHEEVRTVSKIFLPGHRTFLSHVVRHGSREPPNAIFHGDTTGGR